MQTLQTSKEQINYWMETNTFREQCQHLFSKSPYFTTRIDIDFYEESFTARSELKVQVPAHTPVRKKDDIEFFSKHSRTRLIKFFSQIKLSAYYKIYFCTLTFHEDYPKDNIQLKNFLDKFLKRLNYNFSGIDWIWRFEMQKRGAPHFHFILLCKNNLKGYGDEKLKQKIKSMFFDIKECTCNHCVNYGFDFIPLETPSKCFAYISKYIAKTNDTYIHKYSGRRWGSKRTIPVNPIETISLRGHQFVYFKLLLHNHYRRNANKSEYINDNIKSLSSWFLICSTFDIRSLILIALTTDISVIFRSLKKEGYICEKEVLDTQNILLYNYVNSVN